MKYNVYDETLKFVGNVVSDSDTEAFKKAKKVFKIEHPVLENLDKKVYANEKYMW